jgi:AcrR family transcriptional regulator
MDGRLVMSGAKPSFPTRRAAAARNRDKILDAARAAFADPATEVSMAEVARRSGVGMATLYRNFPGRRELLEALYADEVDALCAAARPGAEPAAALIGWLRRLLDFLPGKRLILAELLELTDADNPLVSGSRTRALAAGRPLLTAAQQAERIRADLTIEQIFDMIVALAKIHGEPEYVEPMVRTMLDGLRALA